MSEPNRGTWISDDPPPADTPVGFPGGISSSGAVADLRRFLEQVADVEAAEVVDLLCVDQIERWRRGERVPAEAYLRLNPRLQGESRAAFELIYGEYLLREQFGETPSVSEYAWRFPQFAAPLERQVQLHQALDGNPVFDTDLDAEPRDREPAPPPAALPPRPLPAVPGYEILRELGRGGMGVVYQARQRSLNRVVALKVLRDGFLADAEEAGRFRREAEVVAQLQHPHIVQIYEVGEAEGRPYLALEYVEGGTLQQHLAGTPQAPRVAAALVETLARAMHHAHQRGVIHRDLKPANILLVSGRGEKGEAADSTPPPSPLTTYQPKVTDFGLAKQLNAGGGQTATGAVLGTPSYMAPEQAAGRLDEMSAATDVYALGALLFECLTGRPPFHAPTALATVAQVVSLDPLSPARLQPGIGRDLETVCLKCLEKTPARRYASAADLADDLRRYLNGEPVRARPTPAAERAWKWALRRPVVSGLAAALIVVAGVAFGLVAWQWSRAEERARAERAARTDAELKGRLEKAARQENERAAAGLLLDQGYAQCAQGEVDRGLLTLVAALERSERAGDADLQRVARINLAAWRPQLIHCRSLFPHGDLVMAAAFGPEAKAVVTGSTDRTARLWDAETGRPLSEPLPHRHPVWCVAFAPDGKRVLTGGGVPGGDGEAHLWDAATGKELGGPLEVAGLVTAVHFRPDGKQFLTVCPREAQLWNTATGQREGPPLRHAGADIQRAIFSPDGKTVLTGGSDNAARVWDAETGQPRGDALTHRAAVLAVAFSPDGKTILTGAADGVARLWDATTRSQQGLDMFHRGPVRAVAFSPEGEIVATGAAGIEPDPETQGSRVISGEACLWDRGGRRIGLPLTHPRPVWDVAFSPDSHLLLTGCEDGSARFYRVSSRALIGRPLPHEGTVRTVAFSPDGKRALTASAGGDRNAAARLWDVHPQLDASRSLHHKDAQARSVAFSPDGKTLATGLNTFSVRFWDLATGRGTEFPGAHPHWITTTAFSPDGAKLLTASLDRTVRLWDRDTARLLQSWKHPDDVWLAGFSPDGETVLTGCNDGKARLFTADSGKNLRTFPHPKPLTGAGFAADGHCLWTAAEDAAVRQWDVATGRLQDSWPAPAPAGPAAFSRTGGAALTYQSGNYAQLRDLASGSLKGPLLSHGGEAIRTLTFSPDGQIVATGGFDCTSRLWDTATGKPLSPPLPHSNWIYQLAFRPDGRQLAVAGEFVSCVWPVPAPPGEPSSLLRLRMEWSTGARLDEWGSKHLLSHEELEQRRRELSDRSE